MRLLVSLAQSFASVRPKCRRSSLIGTLVAAAALALTGCAEELRLSLDTDRDSYALGDAIDVVWTLTNEGATAVPFLLHHFPSIWLEDDDGNRPPWIGPTEDYTPPDDDDVTSIRPGSSVNGEYDVDGNYELRAGETYTVRSENYVGEYDQVTIDYWTGEIDAVAIAFDVR